MSANPFSLEGKVALVTGGNVGLGQAIAVALAEAGADIASTSRRAAPETAAASRRRSAAASFGIEADLSIDQADRRHRRANASAISAGSTFSSTTPASSAAPTPSISPKPIGTR